MKKIVSITALIGMLFPFYSFATPSYVTTTNNDQTGSSITIAFNPTNAGDTLVITSTDSTSNGGDTFVSATWNGSTITPTDSSHDSSFGGGTCTNGVNAPTVNFVIQNVTTGSQNYVINWSGSKRTFSQISEYTGVAAAGQPESHSFICNIDNPHVGLTATIGSMLVSSGGVFGGDPTNCPGGWTLRTPTTCVSITTNAWAADVVATSTAVNITWPGTAIYNAVFIVSLLAGGSATVPPPIRPIFFQ